MRSDARTAGRDIVLVHGGWHGGWVWERLTPLLSAAGHRVHAPTLIGLGDREAEFHAGIGWQTHVDEVADLITKGNMLGVVLVGHSYGGGIVTGVADRVPERISALVYLDAIVPQNGVPDWVGFPRERQDAMRMGAERFGGLRVPPPDPSVWGIQPGTAEHRDLQQRLTPHPIKTMMDAPELSERWQGVPKKHYLVAAGPPPSRFTGVHAALTGKPGWRTSSVVGGHEMMWTHPNELAAKLLDILGEQT